MLYYTVDVKVLWRNSRLTRAIWALSRFVHRLVFGRSDVTVCCDLTRKSGMLKTRSQSLPATKVYTCFELSLLFRLKYWVGLYREYWESFGHRLLTFNWGLFALCSKVKVLL